MQPNVQSPDPPQYTVYKSRRRFFRRGDDDGGGLGRLRRPGGGGGGSRLSGITPRRVLKWIVIAVVGWILLSLALFLISAQIQETKVKHGVESALDPGGYTLTSANNILVLGSDLRTKRTHEPGAATSGPSRSDTIMLIRVGGGHAAKLSIPRDTVVDIPGHGRDKINAAYAIGGAPLAITTIKQFLGIKINHVIEVNFDNFPDLVNAMGGIDYTGGCVVSRINGGFKNGGYTLRLHSGTTHIDGKQALALARTRHNDCNKRESDLTRASRQQKVLDAMKSRLTSPLIFPRMPFVAWDAPKAISSDMAGPSLLGVFGSTVFAGTGKTRILKPDGAVTLPDGGAGLTVSDAHKQAAVKRFLAG